MSRLSTWIVRCSSLAAAGDDLIAKLHETTYCGRIAIGEINQPYPHDSAMCVGRLRVHLLPQFGERPSQERLVGGLVDQQHYTMQRHLIDQSAEFEDATPPFACECT